ncbi:hypothetical protein Scep_011473 [Stephania cephalantha]|uniref:O-methyltransferase C-terminal domain-containing protein n=1 Tax=Stephania cephalantha TaxID=152367 RepID=A0AAP0JE77_9MAGN
MAADSRVVSSVLVTECKDIFEGLTSLVDVGGGIGIMGIAIAKAFPDIECSVLDLPHVVASCKGSENLKFVAGDMFQAIPSADAVLLKYNKANEPKPDHSGRLMKDYEGRHEQTTARHIADDGDGRRARDIARRREGRSEMTSEESEDDDEGQSRRR